jgi:hypothetical protein
VKEPTTYVSVPTALVASTTGWGHDAARRQIEEAVEAGVEAAAEWVSSSLPKGQQAWGPKEYQIAERSAREAIAALRQFEAGK